MLKKEFEWYLANQNELVKKYNGKVLVIKDQTFQGAFNNTTEAYEFGKKNFTLGTFLIQRCSPGTEDYTQTFHSRVSFA